MKIELYLFPGDREGELLKKFLDRNNLFHKEIIVNNINQLRGVVQAFPHGKTSLLRIRYSHSIHVITGFQPLALKQLLEHIKKYNPKIEKGFKTNLN